MKLSTDMADSHNPDSFSLTHSAELAQDGGGSFLGHLWASIASAVILTIICCGFYPLLIWGIAQGVFPHQANGSLVRKDGSAATKDEDAVGSALLGQNFSAPGYFHPRPSAAGAGYDATSSGGSNLGPLSDKLINGATNSPTPPATQPVETLAYDGLRLRTIHYAVDNGIAFKLFNVAPDGMRSEVPLKQFEDAQGNLNDVALVDAFPHPTTADDAKRTVLVADDFATFIPADAVTASGSGLDPHISPANAALQKGRIAAARNVKAEQVQDLIDANTDGPGLGFMGDAGVNVLMLNIALDSKYPVPTAAQPAAK